MASSYTKSAAGSATAFEAIPAGIPIPWVEICVAAVFTVFAANMLGSGGLILGAAMFAFMAFTTWITPKALRHRSRASFLASPEGFDIGGLKLPASEIHRLIIRNHVSGEESQGMVFFGGSPVAQAFGGLSVAGMALKQKRLRKLAAVSCRLDVECGGRATTLAGGLDDATAFGLMKDVGAAINL